MTEVEYSYSIGDRLADRNTYFYTPAVGMPMIEAWRASRKAVLGRLPSPVDAPDSTNDSLVSIDDNDTVDTAALLEFLWSKSSEPEICQEESQWLEKLMRKFEFTKRFHRAYGAKFRAVDKSQHKDMDLYVRAADVFLSAYDRSNDTRFLNVLLKILDTLCAHCEGLGPESSGRLAGLLLSEGKRVEVLVAQQ